MGVHILKYFTEYLSMIKNAWRSNNRFERKGQRVLDAKGPTFGTSVSSTGTAKGVQINEILTYVGRPSSPEYFVEKDKGFFPQNWVGQHGQVRELDILE
jgi:hypothetical protein